MMNYASINDAWGTSFDKSSKIKKKETCNNYDSLIDSYLDDFVSMKQNKKTKNGEMKSDSRNNNPNLYTTDYEQKEQMSEIYKQPPLLDYNVEPYSAVSTNMDYEDYFSDKNLFSKNKNKNVGKPSSSTQARLNQDDYNSTQEESRIYTSDNNISNNDLKFSDNTNNNQHNYQTQEESIYNTQEEQFSYEDNYNGENTNSRDNSYNTKEERMETNNKYRETEMSDNNINSENSMIISKYNKSRNNTINSFTNNSYVDLIIYAAVGVLLILMFEQLFRLGSIYRFIN